MPNSSQVAFNYVFASDEYNEFVSEFSDVFAFFINGVNCATVPGSPGVRVSINTINMGTNALFYVNNDIASGAVYNTEMDGFTVVLTCRATVNPNVPNHITLAIADSSDHIVDSNVFIQASSITTASGPSITSQPGAVHVTELRNRINAIRLAHSLGTVTWPAMTAGVTLIRATDLLQMRQVFMINILHVFGRVVTPS